MHSLSRITYTFLYILLFSPAIAIFTISNFSSWSLLSILVLFSIFYGLIFIFIKNKRIQIPRFIKMSVLWVIYFSVSGIIIAFDGDWLRLFNNKHLAFFLILIIIYNTVFTNRLISNVIKVIKVTVILAAVVSIVQVFDNSFLYPQEYLLNSSPGMQDALYKFRRPSIFGYIDANAIGLAFMPLLSVLIGYMLFNKEKGIFIYLMLGGIVAILSNSRYIIIGYLVLSLQFMVYDKVKTKGIIRFLIIVTIGYLVFYKTLIFLGYNINDWFNMRLFAEGAVTDTTRFKAIGTFITFFPQNPFLGAGIMTDEVIDASLAIGSSHIHVGYLSHLVMYGILGCFFLYGFWFLLLKKLYRTAKKTSYWGSFFAFLFFLVAFATMSQSSMFYYGLIFALVFDKFLSDKIRITTFMKAQDSRV